MRPDKDTYFVGMAKLAATRSTCLRRAVGCILVDATGRVLATGYNGVPKGLVHCNQHDMFDPTGYPFACDSAHAKSGESLDGCMAVHAEMNAILQCRDPDSVHTAYVTASPCIQCTKMLMNTGCVRVVFAEEYPHTQAKELWQSVGNKWEQHNA